jgi:hypothetical protein
MLVAYENTAAPPATPNMFTQSMARRLTDSPTFNARNVCAAVLIARSVLSIQNVFVKILIVVLHPVLSLITVIDYREPGVRRDNSAHESIRPQNKRLRQSRIFPPEPYIQNDTRREQ